MRISAGISLANILRCVQAGITPFIALIAAVGLVATLGASPADAKKRHYARHAYAPPQSAMVIDAYSGKILHANKADEPRYPASITKVMTLYLLFEKLKDGRIRLGTELKVSANAANAQPSKLDLSDGDTISVQEAMYALVTKSANDVAITVAENLSGSEAEFARLMTRKAQALGMKHTTFRNASGLPDSGQVTTARDLIVLAQRILADFPEHAAIFKTKVFAYGGEMHRNHNGLLFSYPGTEGMKTGFTHASGFNLLASVKRDDRHLLAVVLGGSSARDRNSRMRSLLNASWGKAVTLASLKGKGKAIVVSSSPAKVASKAAAPETDEGDDGEGEDVPSAKGKGTGTAPTAPIVIAAEDMPERNPAFHPVIPERSAAVAVADDKSNINIAKPTAEKKAAALQSAETAATPVSREPAASPQIRANGAAAATGGNTAASPSPNTSPAAALGPFHVQVGSYLNVEAAKGQLQSINAKASDVLSGHGQLTIASNVQGKAYYRARFGRFSEAEAKDACAKLKNLKIDCLVVRAE